MDCTMVAAVPVLSDSRMILAAFCLVAQVLSFRIFFIASTLV